MLTKTQHVYTLPSELAPLFINDDWSILDYIGDDVYTQCVNEFVRDLEYDGVTIIDVVENSESFVKYHDLADYGVKAADCCKYIAWS